MPGWYQQVRSAVLILHALIGIGLFGYSYQRRKGFLWRAPIAAFAAMLISYFSQHYLYQPGTTGFAVFTQSAVSLINFLLVYLVCRVCLDESAFTALYATTAGMAMQGAAGCFKSIVKIIPAMNALALNDYGIVPLDLLCYGGLFALVFFLFRPYTQSREDMLANKKKTIFSAVVMMFYLANTWLMRDYSGGQSKVYVLVTNVYAILVQSMVFAVQFGVLERDRMSAHLETMKELMHEQRAQYEASRDSVQLINEKYHDLKNMLGSIRGVLPESEMNRLSGLIERYDVQIKTGSEVLDVVLTEKMTLCLQRGIAMTCNIGQVDFGFMEDMDLYTLFNNALTNAINAVSTIPEQQEKYILLSVNQENNMISVHIENPCFERLEFVDGLPQTQGDPDWHGFGMKSMSRTAEKYGGVLSASHHSGCFQLDILLLDLFVRE